MNETRQPLSIGEFSSQTRLSVRMLRHDHRHGILEPERIDDAGYRRYGRDQIAHALLIRDLRDAGFTVSSMAALLAAHGSEVFGHARETQRTAVLDELRVSQQRLRHIEMMIEESKGSIMTAIEIQRTRTPAMTVVSLRGTVPVYSQEGVLWERFMPELAHQGIRPIGPGGVIEHDREYEDENPDLSVFLPVAPGTTANAPLEILHVPEQEVLAARVLGPFSGIAEAHRRVTERLTAEGLDDALPAEHDARGRVFNRYLTVPGEVEEADQIAMVHRPLR